MPRQVAMYLCKSLTHASLPEIGRSFGGKHHSTVIHSIKKVEELRKNDGDFNSLIEQFSGIIPVDSIGFPQPQHADDLWMTFRSRSRTGSGTRRAGPAETHRFIHTLNY